MARWKRSWSRDQDRRLDSFVKTATVMRCIECLAKQFYSDQMCLPFSSQEMPVDLRKKAADLLTQAPALMFVSSA